MKHTISVLVENKPGVLARVSGLFARRSFNIDSLAVGPTENIDVSRMTIVVDLPERPLDHVTKQLDKLIQVLSVSELKQDESVERELMLVKAGASDANRAQVIELAEVFRAKIVDVAPAALTVEITGTPPKLSAFLELIEPFGIVELVRTGRVALGRGPESMKEETCGKDVL